MNRDDLTDDLKYTGEFHIIYHTSRCSRTFSEGAEEQCPECGEMRLRFGDVIKDGKIIRK